MAEVAKRIGGVISTNERTRAGEIQFADNQSNNAWRYASPIEVVYGRPGYMSINIELLGVAA